MKKKCFGNAGSSPLKRSLAGKCLACLGGISIIRPMIAMLLITVLLSSAMVTKAQIKVSREANRYIQIGAKALSIINSPYAKVLGGAVGFLFAEEKLPEYAELKASLEKAWLLDIDDSRKEAYKAFIIARKVSYRKDLATIETFDKFSRPEAMAEAARVATVVFTDIPFFHQNDGGKAYPAGPTLPYLFSAMSLYLDLLKMQINWRQLNINDAAAAGNTEKITDERGRRDALVEQYNKQLVDFWKTIEKESMRAKQERLSQVVCEEKADEHDGWWFSVRDKYYGREDEGYTPNLKYYAHVDNQYANAFTKEKKDGMAERQAMGVKCNETKALAKAQIIKETNSYELADYGFYKTTFDNRAPILYSCTVRLRAIKGPRSAMDVQAGIHLFCPVPGGGIDEERGLGEFLEGNIDYVWDEFRSGRYPPQGYLFIRNEDGSFEFGIERDFQDIQFRDIQTVTNTNDSGPGSLRQAIEEGGRINVYAIEGQTITLTSGPIFIYVRDIKINLGNIKPIKIVSSTNDMIFVITGEAKFHNGNLVDNLLDEKGQPMRCGKTPDGKATTCPGVVQ